MDPLAIMLAAAESAAEESEPSKTAFYILGSAVAAWAVILAAIGLSRPDFPGEARVARGVMALSAVLVVGAMATAVITA